VIITKRALVRRTAQPGLPARLVIRLKGRMIAVLPGNGVLNAFCKWLRFIHNPEPWPDTPETLIALARAWTGVGLADNAYRPGAPIRGARSRPM
jgi:hypothetical protein